MSMQIMIQSGKKFNIWKKKIVGFKWRINY